MQTIIVEKVVHKDEPRLLLKFEKDQNLIELVRKITNCRWSQTRNAWHVPDTPECKVELVRLTGMGITIRWADQTNIKTNQPSQEGVPARRIDLNSLIREMNSQDQKTSKQVAKGRIAKGIAPTIKTENELILFRRYLSQRRYSENTIRTYTEGLKVFLQFIGKPTLEITNADLERFNHDFVVKHQYSLSFQNQVINAVKLFFLSIYSTKFNVDAVERPRREHKLPNVLSKEEVKRILTSPTNVKHRAMLGLIYGCGLRRSELLNLKPNDVDSKRGLLIIRLAKGKKDRVVPLSEKILTMLRDYYMLYKPTRWLFEGQVKGEPYSEESLQKVLKDATRKAKINKPVTLHWLRHSYATHLLESGTDLRYIQELLGHKSSKTTEIYTHVTTHSIQNIKSPFDDL